MSQREKIVFAPLIILVIIMGIYPNPFLDVMHVSVENMVNQINTALNEEQIKTLLVQ